MIIEEIRNIKSDKKTLRKFGLTMGIFLGLLGGFFFWRKKDYYFYFLIFSEVFLFLALFSPFLLKPLHKAWMTFSILLGWLMTRVILVVLFYLVVTPIGLLARLMGKDFLDLRFSRQAAKSYWLPKKKVRFKKSNYERQF